MVKRQEMEVQIRLRKKVPGLKNQTIRNRLKKVLSDLGCHSGELSILLTNDDDITELNRTYRRKNRPTNVLAFPMENNPPSGDDCGMLGDVVVSVDTAVNESKEGREPLDETICRLLIHGILHLLDYDHERSHEEARRMEKEERRLLELAMRD